MKTVIQRPYDSNQAKTQLAALQQLFSGGMIRKERAEILPEFRKSRDAVMAAATLFNFSPTLYAEELDLIGDFKADFAVSDNRDGESTTLLIECEGAATNAAFKQRNDAPYRVMGNKLFEGFGQIVDWLHCIEDLRGTSKLASTLALPHTEATNVHGLVLVGLDLDLTPDEIKRLGWLSSNLQVGRSRVHVMTYSTFFTRVLGRLS